jgi:hypothetical protein
LLEGQGRDERRFIRTKPSGLTQQFRKEKLLKSMKRQDWKLSSARKSESNQAKTGNSNIPRDCQLQ